MQVLQLCNVDGDEPLPNPAHSAAQPSKGIINASSSRTARLVAHAGAGHVQPRNTTAGSKSIIRGVDLPFNWQAT